MKHFLTLPSPSGLILVKPTKLVHCPATTMETTQNCTHKITCIILYHKANRI